MVYSIVHDHGGTVSITSSPGGGTRVSIRLPTDPASADSA